VSWGVKLKTRLFLKGTWKEGVNERRSKKNTKEDWMIWLNLTLHVVALRDLSREGR